MHNLSTVIWFEISRTLKKKSFWLMSLSFPLIAAAIFAIIFFSNKTTEEAAEKLKNQEFSIAVTDESGVIKPQLLQATEAQKVASKQAGVAKVKDGGLDAYIYYPKNLNKDTVEIYSEDVGVFENSRYQNYAEMLLDQSVAATVSAQKTAVLQSSVQFDNTTYRQGEVYNSLLHMIAPGVFLILFYAVIVVFGSQMLTSTTEEKENRVIEMILTTVRAQTLIVGKILSLVTLGLIQVVIILLPIVVVYFLLHDQLALPTIDLTNIPLDPVRIAVAAALFIVSFILFTGLLVTIGAVTPTAKEANGFFGIVMMLIFGPLYASPLFISAPDSALIQFLSYFPFTAPIPLMIRNAVGNLELWQAGLAIMILLVTSAIVLSVAVRAFYKGALEYDRKLNLKDLFAKTR